MKTIWLFLKDQRRLLLFYLVLLGIMLGTFYLHDLSLAPFFDGVLFTAAVLVGYLLLVFYRWLPKYQRLRDLNKRGLTTNDVSFLPETDTTNEGLLKAVLQESLAERSRLQVADQQKRQELLEDFGLWLHQVKTPVAASDLLLQTADPDPVALKGELFKINEYLQLMLNYLRNSLDNNDFVFTQVKIAPLVKEAVKKYAAFFSQKDLTLNLDLLDGAVTTDAKWLQFILEQILFNAIKYTQQGQISISFDGSSLVIQDTGSGIRSEDLPRVFEKGYTGFNGRTQQRASGLGLYLSQQIAEKIGCQLYLTSQVGVGTAVTITFPDKLTQL